MFTYSKVWSKLQFFGNFKPLQLKNGNRYAIDILDLNLFKAILKVYKVTRNSKDMREKINLKLDHLTWNDPYAVILQPDNFSKCRIFFFLFAD